MPDTLLNKERPPIFCPGCSHDQVLRALDRTFVNMALPANRICMVSDIGCSGFFDVFFNTHALHGVHGRALTYAAGIKLCRPEVQVVVTMGDGGLGIGGAHVLAACRRNLDMTLLVLNNFNFGMTGGQFSATTPAEASVGSGFLNKLEKPLDLVSLATAAGAPYVCRCSTYQKDLPEILQDAISYQGFSVVEILGICTGRYTRRNRITPKSIEDRIQTQGPQCGEVAANRRREYGEAYREECASLAPPPRPAHLEARFKPPQAERQEVVFLGAAGQRVISAGEILGLAALSAGLHASQKNEYNVTVLRGPSIAELILSPKPIDYNGSTSPSVVLALAPEGVERRSGLFPGLGEQALVLQASGVDLPLTRAKVVPVDFKALGIKRPDWALASLAILARRGRVLTWEMLEAAVSRRFKGKTLDSVKEVIQKASAGTAPLT